MRKLKNSRKILSLLLLGSFLILIIIFPNSNIVSENKVYDNMPLLASGQTDQTLDNTIDTTRPQVSAPATNDNKTFNITQSEDDAYSLEIDILGQYTDCYATNITLGGADKYDPYLRTLSSGIALRWDMDTIVPKYAHITKAYINLTVANLTYYGMPWNGFNTSISAFEEASTNDFSDPNEILKNDRTLIGDIPWELDGTELIDQTLQTEDVSDLIQQVKVLDGWDGVFGVFIQPGIGTDYNAALFLFETIQFWAYDYGNPKYYPKLFVEWDDTPYFTDTPEDTYVIENAPRFSLKWQVWDNYPDILKVDCNVSIPSTPHYEKWTSGWVTYDLPPLERRFYNFTAYFNDTDGHLIWDSVIVEVGKPQGTYKIERAEDDAWYKPVEGNAFTHTGADLQLGGSDNIKSEEQRVTCLRFNTAIPKHVHIKRAYVNLTVSSVSNYVGGFTNKIYMFYPPVLDFSDDYDKDLFTLATYYADFKGPMLLYRPTSDSSVTWTLPGNLFVGDTIQTPNFTSELQKLIDFGGYNGYIGLYIMPTNGVGSGEKVNTYSYDNGNSEYTPTLFVEWEESPNFMDTPADFTAKNGTRGYHLDWTATDDNPTTFTITCNDTVSNIPYEGVWQSGVVNIHNWFWRKMETSKTKIRYNLPPLDIGVYNFTIRINDAYGNYNLDSVIVKVTNLDLPVLTDIKFIQNGKEVDYFQCGNGPFTIKIYNNTPIDLGIWLTAYHQGYEQIIYTDITHSQPLEVTVTGDSVNTLKFDDEPDIKYNPVLGCYEFKCLSNKQYRWIINGDSISKFGLYADIYKHVNNIEYNLLNRFEIRVNGDAEYIYNQTIYGGIRWARPIKEVWNRDLTPPLYSEPKFIEPDEPDKHYEVNIWAGTEAYGAAVESVFLYYSVDDGPWEETEMILKDGKYYAEIPAQEEEAIIDYYIKITDITGNIIETDEYHEKAPTFEEPSIIIPIIGILLGILGSLSIVAIYRHKSKAAFKKYPSEKSLKKSKKGTKIGNELLQKIKKVRTKQ